MPRGVATAKQLAMMERVLKSYCKSYGVSDPIEQDDIAELVLELFNLGSRDEEALLTELIKRRP
jgi:hypothetical protein